MKRNLLITFIFVLSLVQTSFAQSKVKFTVTPQLSQDFGLTEYIMDIAVDTDTGLAVLGSKLEFPLDAVSAGVKFRVQPRGDGMDAWWVEGGVVTNIDSPDKVMKDTDWAKKRTNLVVDDSYTESRVEMSSILLTIEATRRILHRENINLAVWAGFRYHRIEQDIIGWDGWFIDSNLVLHKQSGTEQGMLYRITYKLPYIGFLSDVEYDRRISLELKAAYTPVFVSDYDNHLLRNKDATASISGHGFLSGVKLQCRMGDTGTRQPFFELAGEFVYLHASGSQTQRWYGDDPITPDKDETGSVARGIPHEINSRQVSVGLRVGLGF